MSRFVALRPKHLPPIPKAVSQTNESGGTEHDDAMARVVKYIPTEMVSGYAFLLGLAHVAPNEAARFWSSLFVFVLLLVLTPVYLIKIQKPQPEQRPQVWIATVAFVLWAYAMGGPFSLPPLDPYYQGWLGGLLVGIYSWCVGLFYVPKKA